jgi:hypothetical protein
VFLVTSVRAQDLAVNLSDESCSQADVSLNALDGLKLIASCESDGSNRLMHISITNTAAAALGALRVVSVGFCGADTVVGAESPAGWVAEVLRRENAGRGDHWRR